MFFCSMVNEACQDGTKPPECLLFLESSSKFSIVGKNEQKHDCIPLETDVWSADEKRNFSHACIVGIVQCVKRGAEQFKTLLIYTGAGQIP